MLFVKVGLCNMVFVWRLYFGWLIILNVDIFYFCSFSFLDMVVINLELYMKFFLFSLLFFIFSFGCCLVFEFVENVGLK